jgi:hypothetical protein
MASRWMLRGAGIAGVFFLALPSPARAITQQATQMMKNWAQSDRCVAAANKQFPDYTADSLAKRDQAVQQCLSNSVLAPRTPMGPGQSGEQQ